MYSLYTIISIPLYIYYINILYIHHNTYSMLKIPQSETHRKCLKQVCKYARYAKPLQNIAFLLAYYASKKARSMQIVIHSLYINILAYTFLYAIISIYQ